MGFCLASSLLGCAVFFSLSLRLSLGCLCGVPFSLPGFRVVVPPLCSFISFISFIPLLGCVGWSFGPASAYVARVYFPYILYILYTLAWVRGLGFCLVASLAGLLQYRLPPSLTLVAWVFVWGSSRSSWLWGCSTSLISFIPLLGCVGWAFGSTSA